MAQTTQKKKGAAPKRSRSSQRSRKSGSASTKARTKTKNTTKPSTSRSRSNGSSGNATAHVDAVRHSVEDKAKSAGTAVGGAASKAKVPLIAGGAALAGAAGGLALAAAHQNRHRAAALAIRKPRIKLTSRDVAKAAKEVGNFSAQMGELATELQRARESANGDRHRSPVEIVLQGLTARR